MAPSQEDWRRVHVRRAYLLRGWTFEPMQPGRVQSAARRAGIGGRYAIHSASVNMS